MKTNKLFLALSLLSILSCSKGEEIKPRNEEISLLSWNIYLGKCNPAGFLRLLNDKSPSIIHLEEAKGSYETFITPFLEGDSDYSLLNDEYSYEGETYVSSTPIIYNSAILTPIEYGIERLRDCYQINDTKTLSWCVFETKQEGIRFFDFNFHGAVLTKKYIGYEDWPQEKLDSTVQEWRVGNVNQILEKRSELTSKYGSLPSLVSGDCNFNRDSEAFKTLLENGFTDSEDPLDPLQSHHSPNKPCEEGKTIDHIFGDSKVNFLEHEINREEDVIFASDHSPVYARINLTNE